MACCSHVELGKSRENCELFWSEEETKEQKAERDGGWTSFLLQTRPTQVAKGNSVLHLQFFFHLRVNFWRRKKNNRTIWNLFYEAHWCGFLSIMFQTFLSLYLVTIVVSIVNLEAIIPNCAYYRNYGNRFLYDQVNNSIHVNSIDVPDNDIMASNGVVHVVKTLLYPGGEAETVVLMTNICSVHSGHIFCQGVSSHILKKWKSTWYWYHFVASAMDDARQRPQLCLAVVSRWMREEKIHNLFCLVSQTYPLDARICFSYCRSSSSISRSRWNCQHQCDHVQVNKFARGNTVDQFKDNILYVMWLRMK